MQHDEEIRTNLAHAGGLHTFTICACAPKLVHGMMQMVACTWYMDTMQSAADSVQALFQLLVMTITKVRYWHLFTTTIIFRAASIVLHNSLG